MPRWAIPLDTPYHKWFTVALSLRSKIPLSRARGALGVRTIGDPARPPLPLL
jgi:hypothetical protein